MASIIDKMVSGRELQSQRRARSLQHKFVNIPFELQEKYEKEGWTLAKTLKKSAKMKKLRPIDELYEDQIWVLFSKMGFTHLNRDRNLRISYDSKRTGLVRQIDVLAIDEEVALVIECKTSDGTQKRVDLKKHIEACQGTREGIVRSISSDFPGRKCIFIFATQHYIVSPVDKERLNSGNIIHLDEDALNYFRELSNHLGSASRY